MARDVEFHLSLFLYQIAFCYGHCVMIVCNVAYTTKNITMLKCNMKQLERTIF